MQCEIGEYRNLYKQPLFYPSLKPMTGLEVYTMDEKQLVEKAYEAVELAKTSGKLRKGTNETTKAIEKGIAKLVVVAKDTNPAEIIMHLGPLCKEKKVPLVHVPSKIELGTAAGMGIGTSSIAIIQEGEAKNIIKQISDSLKVEDGSS